MKLKERFVAATFGFSLAIILVFVLETLELTNQQRAAGTSPQDQTHGIIKSPVLLKTSSIKAFKQRNLQKTDSSGRSEQQLINSAPIEDPQQARLPEGVHGAQVSNIEHGLRSSIQAVTKVNAA